MTFYVYALTNNRAQLIVDEVLTMSEAVAKMVKAHYEAEGLLVRMEVKD